ncbi:MAG: hypothetical protein WBA97_14310 [Actinophytocola sp.]|uniref:hypothetical protein n=1 Tax=Actinophytocola sp. TaxID=1872138 RepID=UPI003C723956
MLQAVLVWSGAVLAIGLLLVMALGPVIVEIDSWFERRRDKKRIAAKRQSKSEAPVAQRIAHPVG